MKKHGGLTQVELAGATGLSPATVSNIVKELSSSGVLHTAASTRSGRRARYVTLAHSLGLVVGVHFATRHLRIVLSDVTHTVLAEKHMPLAKDHRADNELDKTARLIADILDSVNAGRDEVLAIGMALPAPFNRKDGTTARGGIMRGWDGIEVAEVMQKRLHIPCYVDNASNLVALAELRLGAARGRSNVVILDVGEGIGAGLIIGGAIMRGHSGTAGEFGHTTIKEGGPLCRCGNRGCLEAVAGGPAILESLRPIHNNLKLGDVVIRAMAGEDDCIRAIAQAGKHIGVAAANVCNLLDPERVIVGGDLSRAGELLLGPLRLVIERAIIGGEEAGPDVVQAQLGTRGAAIGASLFAIDNSEIGLA